MQDTHTLIFNKFSLMRQTDQHRYKFVIISDLLEVPGGPLDMGRYTITYTIRKDFQNCSNIFDRLCFLRHDAQSSDDRKIRVRT